MLLCAYIYILNPLLCLQKLDSFKQKVLRGDTGTEERKVLKLYILPNTQLMISSCAIIKLERIIPGVYAIIKNRMFETRMYLQVHFNLQACFLVSESLSDILIKSG